MSKANLTIIGLHKKMTSDEVKNTLSLVYQQPESDFDDLCHCLFDTKKPYVLLENVEESKVNLNIATLSRIGFKCRGGDSDMGLSLARVDSGSVTDQICPACENPSGGGDICQHCDVIIAKFLEHKQFDDELEKQLYASSNSQKRMGEAQADKAARQKEIAKSRKKNTKARKNRDGVEGVNSDNDSAANAKPVITVDTQKTSFRSVYAATASFFLLLAGGGYLLHERINPQINTETQLVSTASINESDGPIAPSPEEIASQELMAKPNSIFGERLTHKHNLEMLRGKIDNLLEKELVFSAAGLVMKQEDERVLLFGQQELIKLGGLNQDTRLLSTMMRSECMLRRRT